MCTLEARTTGHLGHFDQSRGEATHGLASRVQSARLGRLTGIHAGKDLVLGPMVVCRDVYRHDISDPVTGGEDLLKGSAILDQTRDTKNCFGETRSHGGEVRIPTYAARNISTDGVSNTR